jgi:hypothetical protein
MMTDDPFDDCETMDEVFALVLDQDGGPEVLQAVLAEMVPDAISRDILERAAKSMAAAGLPHAALVKQTADRMKAEPSSEVIDILKDDSVPNIRARLASLHRREMLTDADYRYMEEHCDQGTLDFVTGKPDAGRKAK